MHGVPIPQYLTDDLIKTHFPGTRVWVAKLKGRETYRTEHKHRRRQQRIKKLGVKELSSMLFMFTSAPECHWPDAQTWHDRAVDI